MRSVHYWRVDPRGTESEQAAALRARWAIGAEAAPSSLLFDSNGFRAHARNLGFSERDDDRFRKSRLAEEEGLRLSLESNSVTARITGWNDGLAQLTGVPSETVLNRRYCDVLEEALGLEGAKLWLASAPAIDEQGEQEQEGEVRSELQALASYCRAALVWCSQQRPSSLKGAWSRWDGIESGFPMPLPTCYQGVFCEVWMRHQDKHAILRLHGGATDSIPARVTKRQRLTHVEGGSGPVGGSVGTGTPVSEGALVLAGWDFMVRAIPGAEGALETRITNPPGHRWGQTLFHNFPEADPYARLVAEAAAQTRDPSDLKERILAMVADISLFLSELAWIYSECMHGHAKRMDFSRDYSALTTTKAAWRCLEPVFGSAELMHELLKPEVKNGTLSMRINTTKIISMDDTQRRKGGSIFQWFIDVEAANYLPPLPPAPIDPAHSVLELELQETSSDETRSSKAVVMLHATASVHSLLHVAQAVMNNNTTGGNYYRIYGPDPWHHGNKISSDSIVEYSDLSRLVRTAESQGATRQWLNEAMTACVLHYGEGLGYQETVAHCMQLCQFSHAVCVPLGYRGAKLHITDGYASDSPFYTATVRRILPEAKACSVGRKRSVTARDPRWPVVLRSNKDMFDKKEVQQNLDKEVAPVVVQSCRRVMGTLLARDVQLYKDRYKYCSGGSGAEEEEEERSGVLPAPPVQGVDEGEPEDEGLYYGAHWNGLAAPWAIARGWDGMGCVALRMARPGCWEDTLGGGVVALGCPTVDWVKVKGIVAAATAKAQPGQNGSTCSGVLGPRMTPVCFRVSGALFGGDYGWYETHPEDLIARWLCCRQCYEHSYLGDDIQDPMY